MLSKLLFLIFWADFAFGNLNDTKSFSISLFESYVDCATYVSNKKRYREKYVYAQYYFPDDGECSYYPNIGFPIKTTDYLCQFFQSNQSKGCNFKVKKHDLSQNHDILEVISCPLSKNLMLDECSVDSHRGCVSNSFHYEICQWPFTSKSKAVPGPGPKNVIPEADSDPINWALTYIFMDYIPESNGFYSPPMGHNAIVIAHFNDKECKKFESYSYERLNSQYVDLSSVWEWCRHEAGEGKCHTSNDEFFGSVRIFCWDTSEYAKFKVNWMGVGSNVVPFLIPGALFGVILILQGLCYFFNEAGAWIRKTTLRNAGMMTQPDSEKGSNVHQDSRGNLPFLYKRLVKCLPVFIIMFFNFPSILAFLLVLTSFIISYSGLGCSTYIVVLVLSSLEVLLVLPSHACGFIFVCFGCMKLPEKDSPRDKKLVKFGKDSTFVSFLLYGLLYAASGVVLFWNINITLNYLLIPQLKFDEYGNLANKGKTTYPSNVTLVTLLILAFCIKCLWMLFYAILLILSIFEILSCIIVPKFSCMIMRNCQETYPQNCDACFKNAFIEKLVVLNPLIYQFMKSADNENDSGIINERTSIRRKVEHRQKDFEDEYGSYGDDHATTPGADDADDVKKIDAAPKVDKSASIITK